MRRAARIWLLAPSVTMLVASLLVAAPSGAGAVSDGQSEAPGSWSAPSTIQAEPLPLLTTPQPGSSFDLSSFDLSSGGIPLEEVAVPPPAEAAKATRTQDEVDPVVLSGARIDGDRLMLVYGGALDEASVPDGGDFAVAVTDSVDGAVWQPTVAGVSIGGRSVTLTLSSPARHADTVAVSYAPGAAPISDTAGNRAAALDAHAATNYTAASADAILAARELTLPGTEPAAAFDPAVRRYSVSLDDDEAIVAGGLALGMPVTVTGGVSGDAFSVVDGVGDTFVEVGGSWSVVVDLGDAFELSSVGVAPPSGGVLGGVVVSGRLGSLGVWTEFGRAGVGGGSVSVTDAGLFRYVRVVPVTALGSGVMNRVGEVVVSGFESKRVSDFDPALSGSLSGAGFSSRLESWSFSDGALSPDSGSASVLVADLCSECDLGHEALVEATVRMLVEFPATNPHDENSSSVNLSVGLEEGAGRRRGVVARLFPWMTFDRGRNRGPLWLGMYCGGGSGGADRLRAEGVDLSCTGGVVEDVVDHTPQDVDVSLVGNEVWVELEYRNLKLWVRVWDKDGVRPVLPQAGMMFGPAHHTSASFNTDEDWVLNPARLVIRSWGWDNGMVKVKDVEVTGMVKGPRRGLARGSDHSGLDFRGRYSPLGRVAADIPVYATDRANGLLPEAVLDGSPEYVSIYDKAWELAYTRTRKPSTSQPWYRTWIDEAFNDKLFQWDMASMMWFAKYMHQAFDAMGSMDIFYQTQRDGGDITRRFRESNGAVYNIRNAEVNPPLFVWAEWQSFRLTGDLDRVKRVLPALREYIDWYSIVRWSQNSVHKLYWNEMRGSGNETLPRPYQEWRDGGKVWADPDTSAMIAQAYLLLGELYDTAGDTAEAADMRAVGEAITDRINRYMWKTFTVDGTTYGQWFYVNANGDIAPSDTARSYVDEPQTASLWVMTLGVDDATKREQIKRLLDSEDWYNTDVPLGTLPKSHSQYQGWGGYGLGQVMSPYTYVAIKGAETLYGYEYAQDFSEKYLDGIAEVYKYSDTIWEHYAPDKQTHTDITNALYYVAVLEAHRTSGRADCTTNTAPTGQTERWGCKILKTGYTLPAGDYAAPARRRNNAGEHPGGGVYNSIPSTVKQDFVGWGGIGPIALLIENVIGIQPDSIDKTITWHMTRTDRHGLNNLWLGGDLGKIDLIAAARTDSYSPAVITVTSANADTTTTTTATLKIIHPSYEDCTTVHVITLNQANQQFTSQPCPGVGLSPKELVVAEGATVSYMVRLATEPTADVTVTISGQAGTDVLLDKTSLTFTTGNWDTSQTVTVTAAQDTDAVDEVVTLTHTTASTDADYEGLSLGIPVTVDDDDTPGLVVSRTGLSLAEGATGTYTVALATEPTADVTVTVTISGQAGTDVSLDKTSLTFTTGNWDTPQTVTVTAGRDANNLDETGMLTHTAASTDADYAGLSLGMPVTVNDTVGLVVSRTGLSLPEESVLVGNGGQGGDQSATYSSDHGQAFTTGNNSNGYAVGSVTIISEDTDPIDLKICEVDGGGAPTEACTDLISPDSFARGSLVFTVPDGSPLTLTPGTTYMVVFKAPDTGTVRVDATSSDSEDSTSLPGWSIRNKFQWNSPTGWQDSSRNNAIRIIISGTVAERRVVAEGATGTYTVALATEPSADVTVTISGQAGTDVSLDKTSLTFTTGNWDTSQTVTVTAAHDPDAADEVVTLTHTTTSTDTDYAGLTLGIPVTVDDDDTPVVLVSNSGQGGNQSVTYSRDHGQAFTTGNNSNGYIFGSVTVISEDPGGDAIDLKICEVDGVGAPTAVCTDLISPDSFAMGSLVFTVPDGSTLTLTPGTTYMVVFKTPDTETTVRVAATSSDSEDSTSLPGWSIRNKFQWNSPNDGWQDAADDHAIRILVSGVVIADDEVAAVTVSAGSVDVGEGDTGTYTVVLDSQPSGAVTVTTASADVGAVTVSPTVLTFTSANWATAQTVTVTAEQDDDADDESVDVAHTAASADTAYDSLAVDVVTVTVTDYEATVDKRLALGMPVTVTGGVSGDAFSVVDGVADTYVELAASAAWEVVVDLGDAFELSSVVVAGHVSVHLVDTYVQARLDSSDDWTQLGRTRLGHGGTVSVTNTGLFRYVRVKPPAPPIRSTRIAEVEVWGFESKRVSDFDPVLSGSLSGAGFSSRLGSWSFSDGALSPGSGSASVLVADLCSECDLGHEALVEATVRMLVEFPATNPHDENSSGVNLSVGLEEGAGLRRGVVARLFPWMTFDRGAKQGPLQLGMYCGGGSGGVDRLKADGVDLSCTGGVVEDVVDHTPQDVDVSLAGNEVWVELEYRNLKLWVRVWDKDGVRPVLPQAGMMFGPAHFNAISFRPDEDWVLNPARLVIRSWGWDTGMVKVKDVEVTGMAKGGELHRWMRQVGHDGRLLKSISNRWRFLVWHSGSVATNVGGSRRCAPWGSALRRRLDGSAGTGPLCTASSTATAGTADTARRPRRRRRRLGR